MSNRVEAKKAHDEIVSGIRVYAKQHGFTTAVIGLSGGIDSAVTCCLACEVLGVENVLGIRLPGPYSSEGSLVDAKKLTENLGIECKTIPITEIFSLYIKTLEPHFAGTKPCAAEENLQARIRANILMAFSNKFGHLVLATGNRSEAYAGYATLYGDLAGGLAPIAHISKGQVYAIADYINRDSEVIPKSIIKKSPSAELKPGQKDQDTLPPYDILDGILELILDEGLAKKEIVKKGYDEKTVSWVFDAIKKSEFKRNQAPPGII